VFEKIYENRVTAFIPITGHPVGGPVPGMLLLFQEAWPNYLL
jgi:hypothetical protein